MKFIVPNPRRAVGTVKIVQVVVGSLVGVDGTTGVQHVEESERETEKNWVILANALNISSVVAFRGIYRRIADTHASASRESARVAFRSFLALL